MRFIPFILVVTFFTTSFAVASQYSTITDKKGRNLEVTLLTHTPTHVTCLKKKGSKLLKIPLSKLDARSVDLIKAFPLVESQVSVKKQREIDDSQEETAFGASYFTFIKTTVTTKVTNDKTGDSDITGQIYYIGEASDTTHVLISTDSFSVPHSPEDEVWKNEKFAVPERVEFKGYVLFITDNNNRILSSKASVASFKGKLNNALLELLSQTEEGEKISPELISSLTN